MKQWGGAALRVAGRGATHPGLQVF